MVSPVAINSLDSYSAVNPLRYFNLGSLLLISNRTLKNEKERKKKLPWGRGWGGQKFIGRNIPYEDKKKLSVNWQMIQKNLEDAEKA